MELKLLGPRIRDNWIDKWFEDKCREQAKLTLRQVVEEFETFEINPYLSWQQNNALELEKYRNLIDELRKLAEER